MHLRVTGVGCEIKESTNKLAKLENKHTDDQKYGSEYCPCHLLISLGNQHEKWRYSESKNQNLTKH